MEDIIAELRQRKENPVPQDQINEFLDICWKAQQSGNKREHKYKVSDFNREYWMPDLY